MQELVQNYGLFWKTEDVYWGAGSQPGALYGVPADATSEEPIDFREQIAIYVLYAEYDLVYVGQTGSGNDRLFVRLKYHRRKTLRDRWNRFSWFGIRRVRKTGELGSENAAAHATTEKLLDHLEAILIAAAEPPLNRQGGKFGGAVRYRQFRDDRLGLRDSELLRRLTTERGLTDKYGRPVDGT